MVVKHRLTPERLALANEFPFDLVLLELPF